jgi:hypothetical protein
MYYHIMFSCVIFLSHNIPLQLLLLHDISHNFVMVHCCFVEYVELGGGSLPQSLGFKHGDSMLLPATCLHVVTTQLFL